MAEGGGCTGPSEVSHGQAGHAGGAEAPGTQPWDLKVKRGWHGQVLLPMFAWAATGKRVRLPMPPRLEICTSKTFLLTGDYNCNSLLRDATIDGACPERSCLPCRRFRIPNGM